MYGANDDQSPLAALEPSHFVQPPGDGVGPLNIVVAARCTRPINGHLGHCRSQHLQRGHTRPRQAASIGHPIPIRECTRPRESIDGGAERKLSPIVEPQNGLGRRSPVDQLVSVSLEADGQAQVFSDGRWGAWPQAFDQHGHLLSLLSHGREVIRVPFDREQRRQPGLLSVKVDEPLKVLKPAKWILVNDADEVQPRHGACDAW
jgi:hypothetical protein